MTTIHIGKSPPRPHISLFFNLILLTAVLAAKNAASHKSLEIQAHCGHKTTKNPFEVKICWNIRFQPL